MGESNHKFYISNSTPPHEYKYKLYSQLAQYNLSVSMTLITHTIILIEQLQKHLRDIPHSMQASRATLGSTFRWKSMVGFSGLKMPYRRLS
jgi:uncharacterized protein (DUF2461 family)